MKRSAIVFAFLALASQFVWADVKTDVLTLTGNVRTKLVWVRWPWCDNSYAPVQAYKSPYYENDHNFTQLVVYDTDEGAYRLLDSTIGSHCFPRITAKDGKYIIWNDNKNACAWIRDFAGTAPAHRLISSGDYYVLATQYNPATDSEFIYVMGGYDGRWVGQTIVRIPLKDSVAVLTSKKTVVNGGGNDIDWHANVSQDGKYVCCMVPQPDMYLWLAGTTTKIGRHADALANGGCQPNIAPDNSYRCFHLLDAHTAIGMFGPGTTASLTAWSVNIVTMLPGNTGGKNNANQPRWTNNVQFMTVGYPLETGLVANNGQIFTMTAAQVKAADASTAGSFCLAKFSTDFKSVSGAVRVSDGDVRHREVVGDAWLQPSTVAVSGVDTRQAAARRMFVSRGDGLVTVNAGSRAAVRVTDARGRLIRLVSGSRAVTIDTRELDPGVYVISSTGASGCRAQRLTIGR